MVIGPMQWMDRMRYRLCNTEVHEQTEVLTVHYCRNYEYVEENDQVLQWLLLLLMDIK